MRTASLNGFATIWDELPLVARLFLLATAAGIIAIIAWPHCRQACLWRRIRKLPPPVIKRKIEPDLRLPRGHADEPPAG
jgi:hypothetical protein